MTDPALTPEFARQARLAGMLYLLIIVAGLGAELGLRGPLIELGDAAGTAAAQCVTAESLATGVQFTRQQGQQGQGTPEWPHHDTAW